MKHMKSFIFFLVFISLIVSGCLQEYNDIHITDVDILSVPKETATGLTITTYIQNNQNTDSGSLSLRVKVEDPSINLNVAEMETDIGYIKSNSQSHHSVSLTVPEPGEYFIDVALLENGNVLSNYGDFIIIKARTDVKEPANIQLTDMNLVIKQYVDGVSKVVVDVSPGIHNQGGDSEPLTMVVKAMVDPYTVYTESDEMGIIEGSARVRGDVSFILPKNSEYTFSVNIEEKGSTIVSGDVDEIIKLNEIYFNTPMTYMIIEEGIPPVPTEAPTGEPKAEPGFSGIVALSGLLIMFSIMVRTQNKR